MENSSIYFPSLDIIHSAEFKYCYEMFLSIDYGDDPFGAVYSSKPNKEIYHSPEELVRAFEDWQKHYEKLPYLLDKHAFSPFWVPIYKRDYTIFLDLANPNWPIYHFSTYYSRAWKRRTTTLSIKALSSPLAKLNELLAPGRYYAKEAYWDNQPTYDYLDYRLAHKPKVDSIWDDLGSIGSIHVLSSENAHVIYNLLPGKLNAIPKEMRIKVLDLAYNAFDTVTDFHQYMPCVYTMEDLMIVLECGLWHAIDLLRIELENGVEVALISHRKAKLWMTEIKDASSWEAIITPWNKELFEQLSFDPTPF